MAKYKLQVLQQADACTAQGEIGALLRREGLYSLHLSSWRRLRESGALAGLTRRVQSRCEKVLPLIRNACKWNRFSFAV